MVYLTKILFKNANIIILLLFINIYYCGHDADRAQNQFAAAGFDRVLVVLFGAFRLSLPHTTDRYILTRVGSVILLTVLNNSNTPVLFLM